MGEQRVKRVKIIAPSASRLAVCFYTEAVRQEHLSMTPMMLCSPQKKKNPRERGSPAAANQSMRLIE